MAHTSGTLHLIRILAVLAAALVIASCGSSSDGSLLSSRESLPPASPLAGESFDYRLGPGDRVSVKVFGQADLSGDFDIAGDGKVSMPLIGQVQAANLTLAQFRDEVTRLLNQNFLVDPKVALEVTNYRPFYILGQVNTPGNYPYRNGINMRMAVALAGGYTRRAAEEPLIVDRRDANGTPARYWATQETPVLPGDTITVRRRLF